MSETTDLFALHGAIDRYAQRLPDGPAGVPPLFSPLGDTVGWFDRLATAIAPTEFSDGDGSGIDQDSVAGVEGPFPGVDEALAHMAERRPRGRSQQRRLLAIADLARVDPSYGPEGEHAELTALALRPLTSDGSFDTARALLSMLVDVETFAGAEQWEALQAAAGDVFTETLRVQHSPPACASWITQTEVAGKKVDALVIETTFQTDQLGRREVLNYLNPENWPDCSEYWCSMEFLGRSRSTRTYLEIVSLDCRNRSILPLRTCLDFRTRVTRSTTTLTYNLSTNQTRGDGKVVVDQGWIRISDAAPAGVTVRTHKMVKFGPPFDGVSMCRIVCLTGYGEVAEEMLFSCALDPD